MGTPCCPWEPSFPEPPHSPPKDLLGILPDDAPLMPPPECLLPDAIFQMPPLRCFFLMFPPSSRCFIPDGYSQMLPPSCLLPVAVPGCFCANASPWCLLPNDPSQMVPRPSGCLLTSASSQMPPPTCLVPPCLNRDGFPGDL